MENHQKLVTHLNSLSELSSKTLNHFQLARLRIQLYTRNIDPRILNSRDIEQSIIAFIRSSRNARVEILIRDEAEMRGFDHCLINLAQKFTSYINVKVIPKKFHENLSAFYLIDKRHLIDRILGERFEANIHQLPSAKINQRIKYFEEVWQQATPASQLRALHL